MEEERGEKKAGGTGLATAVATRGGEDEEHDRTPVSRRGEGVADLTHRADGTLVDEMEQSQNSGIRATIIGHKEWHAGSLKGPCHGAALG